MSNPTVPLRDVVVLSDSAYIDGGGAAVALSGAIALARTGLRVTVVSAVGPPMRELLEEPNVRVFCGDQDHLAGASSPAATAIQGLWNARAAKLLQEALVGCKPGATIVHVHGWTKALSASVFRTAVAMGHPVVVTLHDFFAICPNGSLYVHPERKICTLEPMGVRCIATDCDSRNYGVKVYRVVRQLVQRVFAGMPGAVRHFISVSEFSRSIIQPHLPSDARVYAVANPIDRAPADPARPEMSDRFAYVGRLSPEKGATLFAEAARDAGVEAFFAGDGPCASDVAEINPKAQLLGWLSRADVEKRIAQSRALVFPSLWYETYGLSVMEAAAVGVPAIVPDTSAAKDLVIDNETGLLFEGGNVVSLTAKLREMSREGVAERLGAGAYRRYWSDPPTMAKHVAALLSVYRNILNDAA